MDTSSGFDKAWMLNQIGGDLGLLHEVAKVFLDDYPRLQEQINLALQAQDSTALYSAAHAMKSAVGNFGAKAAVNTAQSLERACKDGDAAAYPALAAALLQGVETLAQALVLELEHNA
ncbi:Hpt domain-containing protein [Uliginosibacterium gangwonense]|uniref:Hpt domain-containing protein n=1 Tax=Uliginosibacterium gangwonense TaxID=392736 RepID=UPI00036513B5|nr:Hpt domain-containing protein [Uliginosibacterium gangwonense]